MPHIVALPTKNGTFNVNIFGYSNKFCINIAFLTYNAALKVDIIGIRIICCHFLLHYSFIWGIPFCYLFGQLCSSSYFKSFPALSSILISFKFCAICASLGRLAFLFELTQRKIWKIKKLKKGHKCIPKIFFEAP